MPTAARLTQSIASGKANPILARLYGDKPAALQTQTRRYLDLIRCFTADFPSQAEVEIFSTPGRTEVGGNHTDHNAGRILAAAVDLDVLAAAAPNSDGVIRVHSAGYPPSEVKVNELDVVEGEKYTSTALIRGVCARLHALGYRLGGFDACATSNVLKGSGLSSSAAYEVLITTILDHFYNQDRIDPILNAQISQFAENNFFGKPCGLMDQTTAAVGGFVTIDFKDFAHPIVKKVEFDFNASGFTLVIVDTGGNHADLNDDYTALEHEMKAVAKALGGQVLREFSKQKVLDSIPFLRGKVNDRAIQRAIHFYDDDQRVVEQVRALETGQFEQFLRLIIESGYSSWMLCQNIYSNKAWEEQGIAIGLAVSENLLKGRGAWRVHGGGFAGTIQAFTPNDLLPEYLRRMRAIFGERSCYELLVRPAGTIRVDIP